MKYVRILIPFFAAVVLLSSCVSYSTHVEPSTTLTQYKRYWVKTNLDDNHAIEFLIVKALQKRGLEVGSGHETMMPRGYQVLVTFRDYWGWDFREHMSGLELKLTDIKKEKPLAVVDFVGPLAVLSSPDEVVDTLVDKLLKAQPKVVPPRTAFDAPDPTKPASLEPATSGK